MTKRFTEDQIIGFLREVDEGGPLKVVCRKLGLSEASYYLSRNKFLLDRFEQANRYLSRTSTAIR